MHNYFGPSYFGELKPFNSKYCSNFVLFFGLQLIFVPFNFAVLFGLRNSRNKGTQTLRVLQQTDKTHRFFCGYQLHVFVRSRCTT